MYKSAAVIAVSAATKNELSAQYKLSSKINNKLHVIHEGWEHLLSDSQLSHSIVAFYVVDSKSGTVLIDKNGTVGLAAASTQKVITSSTAFALLGHNYTYKTTLQYDGNLLNGDIILKGSGDPTFGSWRYTSTK